MFRIVRFFSNSIPELPRIQRGLPKKSPIDGVKHIIVVASGKGGVGKSTISVNLSVALSNLGRRTGLLDADLFGPSIPKMMNLSTPPAGLETIKRDNKILLKPLVNYGVKCMSMGFLVGETAPVVWRGLMVMKAVEQLIRQVDWSPLDVLVIDMPPGTGDTQLSITQLLPISGAVIVTTPQNVAVSDARKGVEMFRKLDIPIIGIVNNMSRFRCGHCEEESIIFKQGKDLEGLINENGMKIIADIPLEADIAINSDRGIPMIVSHPSSSSSQSFNNLAQIIDKIII